MEGTLLARTKVLLRDDGRSYEAIAKGSGLSIYWIRKLRDYQNPSVNKVQQLFEFLSERSLSVV